MTMTPSQARAMRLKQADVDRVTEQLLCDWGQRPPDQAELANMFLLDALDRGERDRFVVWAGEDPISLLYVSPSGTLVPAGLPQGGPGLVEAAERTGWRVLVGDRPMAEALLDAYPRRLFRRRPSAREQRFMYTRRPAAIAEPQGFRRARAGDVEALTELACKLHVEDRMGPPIARGSRGGVRARMADSARRGLTYVVERDRRVIAKFDVSLYSRRRGAQIAGVYVEAAYRGQNIAAGAVAALSADLMTNGVPGVTLHVRSDNVPAIRAYERSGLVDGGPWLLALR